jgi:hypothetical protein
MAHPAYEYFGDILLSPGATAPPPTLLRLGADNLQTSSAQQASATEYTFTVTNTYQEGSDPSHRAWTMRKGQCDRRRMGYRAAMAVGTAASPTRRPSYLG